MKTWTGLAALAALVAMASPSTACSVREGYRVPTTLDLVEQADAIVLARVEPGSALAGARAAGWLQLAPVLAIKGPLPHRLSMPGWLETAETRATRSDADELARANPDAFSGACSRYIFAPGMTLLLFVRRAGEGWRVISEPFARTAEDVPAFDSRWVRAVREYIAIAALPKAVQRARLEARRNALAAKSDPDAQAIAADMDRVIAGGSAPLRARLPPASD